MMHTALAGTQSLNNHDEIANSVLNSEEMAQRINKSVWDSMLRFSPIANLADSFMQSLVGLKKLHEDGVIDTRQLRSALHTLLNVHKDRFFKLKSPAASVALALVAQHRYEAVRVQLEAMTQMAAIDQYTWEGGQYMVTEQNIKDAEAALAEHLKRGAQPEQLMQDVAKYLDDVLAQKTSETTKPEQAVPAKQETAEQVIEESAQEDVDDGSNTIAATEEVPVRGNQELINFFEKKNETTAGELITKLVEMLGKQNRENKKGGKGSIQAIMYMELLTQIQKLVNKDLKIRYITKADTIKGEYREDAAGWFTSNIDGTAGEIYIVAAGEAGSNVSIELMLHELLHAAISRELRKLTKSEAVKNLETLLDEVRKQLPGQFTKELSDVHEFVSYGLSNAEFRNALMKLKGKERSKTATALTKLFNTLMSIIFGKTPKATAYTDFLLYTSNILQAAEGTKTRALQIDEQGNVTMDMAAIIDNYSTVDVFQSLDDGTTSAGFKDQLSLTLSSVAMAVSGDISTLKRQAANALPQTPMDAWLNALATGEAPYASKLDASPFTTNQQASFVAEQVEAAVRAVLDMEANTASSVYRELRKLYQEARTKLTPAMFDSDPAVAQQKYDFVFKVESTHGVLSDYLSRFVALGLANEEFNKLLDFSTNTVEAGKPTGFLATLANWFSKAMDFLSNKQAGTFSGQQANSKLLTLAQKLASIEARRKRQLNYKIKTAQDIAS